VIRAFIRSAYVVTIWLFVAGVIAQFILAGLALFDTSRIWPVHVDVGFTIGYVLLLNVVFGLLGRLPRAAWGRLGMLFLLYVIQTTLPSLRHVVPWIAALHPINAAIILWAGVAVARHARRYAPKPVGIAESKSSASGIPEPDPA